MTSASVVWVKFSYHSPTALKPAGAMRQTSSSTEPASSGSDSAGATGTARTIRAAPEARAT